MAKLLSFSDESRGSLERGMNALADAVRVTIGPRTVVERSIVSDSLIGSDSSLSGVNLAGSMIGNQAVVSRRSEDLSLGDFSASA